MMAVSSYDKLPKPAKIVRHSVNLAPPPTSAMDMEDLESPTDIAATSTPCIPSPLPLQTTCSAATTKETTTTTALKNQADGRSNLSLRRHKRGANNFYASLPSPRNRNNNKHNNNKSKPASKFQQRAITDLQMASISSPTVTSSDYFLHQSSSTNHSQYQSISSPTLNMNHVANDNHNPSLLNVPSIEIQVSSFTPVSRRIRHDPQYIAIHAGIPSSSNQDGDNEDPPEADSSNWIPIVALTCLPAVIRLPSTAKHLRFSFHTTKPSKHIGDAMTSIVKLLKTPQCIVLPIKHRMNSKSTLAVVFLRCSLSTNQNISYFPPSSSPKNNKDGIPLNRAGLSLVSRIAPSMIRESRHVSAIVLSVVINKDGKEYSWPAGRVSVNKKLDRSGSISAPSNVLWFGISNDHPNCMLKIQWMGPPKKGLTFVHGVVSIEVDKLSHLKKGELLSIPWTESSSSIPVHRSILVEHISFRDNFWLVNFSLTR